MIRSLWVKIACGVVMLGTGGRWAPAQLVAVGEKSGSTAGNAAAKAEQALLAKTVTLDLKGVSLERAIDVAAASAGVRISYNTAMLESVPNAVTMHVRQIPLGDVLDQLLFGTSLGVIGVPGNMLAIVRQSGRNALVSQGRISGKVVDGKTKQPIRGATVTVDESTKGVTSGDDGGFHLATVAPGEHTIRVRMVGYVKATKSVTVVNGQSVSVEVVLTPSVSALDQVVVTGTIVATEQKAIPNAMTVITAKDIEQRGITKIDQLFRGDVPGLFAQNQGSYNLLDQVQMFSRGATAIKGSIADVAATNPIKTYLDGVELADPSYLSQIDPRSIERIEIITGPQASTIYGSNAINGVMQIFTKRGTTARPQITATLSSGLIQNNFTPALTPQHDYTAQVNGIEGRWSYNAGGGWNFIGAWTPARQTTRINGFGGARLQLGPVTADGVLRLSTTQNLDRGPANQRDIDRAQSGLYSKGSTLGIPDPTRNTLGGQTLGLTLSYAPASWWSNELVVGTDATSTENRQLQPGQANPTDSTLLLSSSNQVRQSIRYATTAQLPLTAQTRLTLTFGADTWQDMLDYLTVYTGNASLTGTLSTAYTYITRQPTHNTGAFVQGQLGLRDALFFTYGLRAEWNPAYGDEVQPNFAPRFGAAYTRDVETPFGAMSVKVRGSYGRSTRPPTSTQKLARAVQNYYSGDYAATLLDMFGQFDVTLANPELTPESQQGGEGGIELYFGNRGSLIVTRYNQTVNNLILDVGQVDSVRSLQPFPGYYGGYDEDAEGYVYALQDMNLNIGNIRNQGWELQGTINTGPFTTRGTYSWTKSRIIGIAEKYRSWFGSDWRYQVGATSDFLPEHTWAVNVTYTQHATSVSLNVNGIAHTRYSTSSNLYTDLYAIRLKTDRPRADDPFILYTANAYTMADLNASHQFSQAVTGILQVQNLSNYYRNDIQTQYAALGRQTKAGLRIRL